MASCEKRIGELEVLIAKIYGDNALGKLPDKRYETLSCQIVSDAGVPEIPRAEKPATV